MDDPKEHLARFESQCGDTAANWKLLLRPFFLDENGVYLVHQLSSRIGVVLGTNVLPIKKKKGSMQSRNQLLLRICVDVGRRGIRSLKILFRGTLALQLEESIVEDKLVPICIRGLNIELRYALIPAGITSFTQQLERALELE